MSRVLVLDKEQTRAGLDPGRVLDAVAAALVALSRGEVSAPPRIAAVAPAGLLGAMPAYVPGLGLAAKLVSVFATPGASGRSSHRGLVALFDHTDGRPLGLLDAEPITAVRTAASATLSLRTLAPDARRIAVIGTGVQASAQVALLAAVHPALPVTVGARDGGQARALAATHPNAGAATIEQAVRGADAVFCCTGATTPVFPRAWLAEGAHVSSVGGSHGHELDRDVIRDGTLFAEWPGAAAAAPPAGAYELQDVDPQRVTLLGAVLDGRHPGRVDRGGLTVFKSTGHGALDVAAASVVHAWARDQGVGTAVDL
ncbi:delta(1)-pyrroline-2-carboxylate reductase [Catellatospora sp. IY07-71]|uniref:ornithine cyclodeaminase family protein n=1 Tax=Catellatospora sp. IY07-71 TaxID=2728827 RepID=UPI001BB3E2AA|nr:ornithine cyclodeaminase family protein [Catellatospora sp. IY07-71]BCJ74820.1 delta(1)-pyrroline-2-carboxylate reductase [Catellatospora sp. IY07-71]